MTDAANDHERGAVAEVGGEARHLDLPGEQLALLAHVLDRVVREALERLADLAAAGLGLGAHAGEVEHFAAGRAPRPSRVTSPSRTVIASPSESSIEQRIVRQVDQVDARFDEQLGAEVRVGAAGGGAAVQHRADVRGDQLLGRDPVDVEVVDQRDIAAGRDA